MMICTWFKVAFSQQSEHGPTHKVKNAGEWMWLPEGVRVPQGISAEALQQKALVPGAYWPLGRSQT